MSQFEREQLTKIIEEWNSVRIDLFGFTLPDENLEFEGNMRFFFEEEGQKVFTKVIRVASSASTRAVIMALVDKFHPDLRMLSQPEYSLWEVHEHGKSKELMPEAKPLLVQLSWHKDGLEGRFVLTKKGVPTMQSAQPMEDVVGMKRKLSRREKKELKKQQKRELANRPREAEDIGERLYSEVPQTTFTRTISNPEIVMKKRRERKLQQKLNDLGQGGSLKVYGDDLHWERPYVTLLVSMKDRADKLLHNTLEKYSMERENPNDFALLQIRMDEEDGRVLEERELGMDECPLLNLANTNAPDSVRFRPAFFRFGQIPSSSRHITFDLKQMSGQISSGKTTLHVRRRRDGGAHKPGRGAPGQQANNQQTSLPYLLQLNPDGSDIAGGSRQPNTIPIPPAVTEIGSDRKLADLPNSLLLNGPYVYPRHCVLAHMDGYVTITPSSENAELAINGVPVKQTNFLNHNAIIRIGRNHVFRFIHPHPPRGNVDSSMSSGSGINPNESSYLVNREAFVENNSNIHDNKMMGGGQVGQTGGLGESAVGISGRRSRSEPDGLHQGRNHLSSTSGDDDIGSDDQEDGAEEVEAIMETTFDIDGRIDTKTHTLPLNSTSKHQVPERPMAPKTQLEKSPSAPVVQQLQNQQAQQQQQQQQQGRGGGGTLRASKHMIPAIIELLDKAEDKFLSCAIRDANGTKDMSFALSPVYTLYMVFRYRLSPHYSPSNNNNTIMSPSQRSNHLVHFLTKTVNLLHVTIQDHCHDAEALAFWMANGSELLNFVKMDSDIVGGPEHDDVLESLGDAVEKAYAHLTASLKHDLTTALPPLLDASLADQEAVKPTLYMLSSALGLFGQCKLNSALSLQLLSQLFYYISMYLFNWLVSREGVSYRSMSWGRRLSARLNLLQKWANNLGLELAMECHMDRIVQAVKLLETPKTIEELATLGSTCYKLNSLQVRELLERYQCDRGEPPIDPQIIHNVVQVAETQADKTTLMEGKELMIEEAREMDIPFLIPQDGYTPESINGIPPGLQHFIDSLLNQGLMMMIIRMKSIRFCPAKRKVSDSFSPLEHRIRASDNAF